MPIQTQQTLLDDGKKKDSNPFSSIKEGAGIMGKLGAAVGAPTPLVLGLNLLSGGDMMGMLASKAQGGGPGMGQPQMPVNPFSGLPNGVEEGFVPFPERMGPGQGQQGGFDPIDPMDFGPPGGQPDVPLNPFA